MNSILVWSILALGSHPQVAEPLHGPADNGTLIFLENCNSVVEFSTGGKIGHVALVFTEGNESYIYEATPAKVRRVLVAEYYAELGRINKRRDADEQVRVWALQPKQAYTDDETTRMREFLEAQIGRRYSLRNYVRRGKADGVHSTEIGPLKVEIALAAEQKPVDGIHCAELASATLNHSGRYAFKDFHKIHPQALYSALLPSHQSPREIVVPLPTVKHSWCVRAQRRWTECWTWCGWSCGEAWSFCW